MCWGGGKGALIQEDLSATLATNNDQYLFQPLSPPPGIRVQSGSVRKGPGHRVGGGDIPDFGSQYVGDRTDSVLPDAFAIENHPQDCRVKLSEDGTVQTLAARMGTGGGNTPIVLQSCSGRSSTGDMSKEK